jgi:D-psicose/D-tagatose/L-ribulose 3-epimerase
MKFGIHLSTYTKSWEEDVLNYIPISKEFGYDGVEFPLMDPDTFQVTKAKKLINEMDLECTCGTGMNLNRDISSLDPDIKNNGIKHLKQCIDLCNTLETDCLGGVLYAPWGQYKTRHEAAENIKTSLENLNLIGDYAKEKGVTLALEMINRYETYFINTVNDGKNYLKTINHPNVKLHFDTFHGNIEEKNMKNALIEGGDDIYHVHFCENDRGIPGTGNINWNDVKIGLEAINYNRWITLENFVMPNCEVGKDTFIWRKIEKDGLTVAKESIKFIKELFEN